MNVILTEKKNRGKSYMIYEMQLYREWAPKEEVVWYEKWFNN